MLRAIKPWKPKAPRAYSVRWLEAQLDDLTSRIVRINEQTCFNDGCTETGGLECGHLFERRHRATRWDITPDGNCHSQCSRHNRLHEEQARHYRDAFILRFGERVFDDLASRAHAKDKITYIELEAKYLEYKEILAPAKTRRLKGKPNEHRNPL